jgi:ribulose 1,5-bisphosphate synthetase/thiazole synthase
MTSPPKFILLAGIFSLLTLTIAVPAEPRLDPVDEKEHDYIVVGGGLSGLVVANRLTGNQNGEF